MAKKSNHSQDILAQWLNGELGEEEVKNQIGTEDFAKYDQILREVDHWIPSNDTIVFDPKEVTVLSKKGKQRFLGNWQVMSMAASFLLILFAGYYYYFLIETIHTTSYGQVSEIVLPDGKSIATLAPHSTIRWRKSDWTSTDRILSLTGKAHFKVYPGRTFNVTTASGSVEVLGTAFDVHQFDNYMNVVCYEVKVRATNDQEQDLILTAGESALSLDGRWENKEIITTTSPAWFGQEVKFTNAPIVQVISEIKAYYNIEVDLGNINLERRFTGSFPTDNLEQALQIVFGTLGINYKLENGKVYLSK